jgi:hypothetical protein
MIGVDYNVLNQRGSPSWFSDIYANIPTAGYKGRMFISTDTFAFYRDTGTGWDLIGGPGTGTITGSGTSGQVSYFNGSSTLAGSNNLFWDITNSRLGIGTATPGAALDIHATGTNAQFNGTSTNNAYLQFQNAGTSKWRIGNTYNAGANSYDIYNNGLTTNAISISSTTNNAVFTGLIGVGTGATTPPAAITSYSASAGTQFKAVGTAPAITFSDTLSSPPYNCAIGMATAFSNFITGANIGDLCITNQTTPSRAIIFGLGTTEKARISPGGYFLLGTSTESSFLFDCNGQGRFQNILTLGSTLSNGTYFYTLPSATGTLALTSNLSSYLPLTGGTLTGQLYINPTNTGITGLDVASNNTSFRSDNLEGNKRQLLITMGSGTLIQFTAKGYGANYGTDLAFYTSSASGINGDPGIYITGTNNFIGINTGSPQSTFVVAKSGNTATLELNMNVAGISRIFSYNRSSPSGLPLALNDPGGNVIIGSTTDQGSKAQVYGSFASLGSGAIMLVQARDLTTLYGFYAENSTYLNFYNTLGSNVTGQFTRATGVYTPLSDINKKKDFELSTIGLDAILGLKPTLYRMKEDEHTSQKHLGFIAQDVKDFIPQAYVEDENFIGLNYNPIIATIVKAIQELNDKLVRNNIN